MRASNKHRICFIPFVSLMSSHAQQHTLFHGFLSGVRFSIHDLHSSSYFDPFCVRDNRQRGGTMCHTLQRAVVFHI
jgi:hypothetical protein